MGSKKTVLKVKSPLPQKTVRSPKKLDKKPKGKGMVYQQLGKIDHALKRPEMYIGPVKTTERDMYIVHENKIEEMLINYNPGFIRIFIEILSNAVDNYIRSKKTSTPMKNLIVDIKNHKEISVYNDGLGIEHIEIIDGNGKAISGTLAPIHIFSKLNVGSNFDDTETRETSGKNGYGAKLTNIFSKYFKVESFDQKRNQLFVKTWTDNMRTTEPHKIVKAKGKSGWTRITFIPDYEYFGFKDGKLPIDVEAYLRRLVEDVNMEMNIREKKVKVEYNGEELPICGFSGYVKKYAGDSAKMIELKTQNSHAIIVDCSPYDFFIESKKGASSFSEEKDGTDDDDDIGEEDIGEEDIGEGAAEEDDFVEQRAKLAGKCISFVNGIFTIQGGIHVETWMNKFLTDAIPKFQRSLRIKTIDKTFKNELRKHLAIFVVCDVDKPEFESQSKERLISPAPNTVAPTATQISKVLKWPVRQQMIFVYQQKELKEQAKTDPKGNDHLMIKGLQRANYAGKKGYECVLLLTEGKSAAGTAAIAINARPGGRNIYGLFPLKGKPLNTRNANVNQINKNAEITAIKKILKLKYNVDYSDDSEFNKLPYRGIELWTDQDLDGDHIKGLILNYFEKNYPSLIERGFIRAIMTPIIYATKKIKKGLVSVPFFDLETFKKWRNSSESRGYNIKYIKGLGTILPKQIRDYMSDGNKVNMIEYEYNGKKDSESMELAFLKTRADQRKNWIMKYDGSVLDVTTIDKMNLTDFVNNVLLPFSVRTTQRSLPSMVDGLKEGQRKVLAAAFKRKLINSIKVAQFAGYVSEHMGYHHGEASLQSTITGMAQCFIGKNNMPLFTQEGIFGSRYMNGQDAASARYIYTCLSTLAQYLFNSGDNDVLEYQYDDDNNVIEPKYYCPVIPLVLANGCRAGIATGFACTIDPYDPLDIIKWCRAYIKGEVDKENMFHTSGQLKPYFLGYTGDIELVEPSSEQSYSRKYTIRGKYTLKNPSELHITELPINIVPDNYNDRLNMMEYKKEIESVKMGCSDNKVLFIVNAKKDKPFKDIAKKFQLEATLNLSSTMYLLNENGIPQKYNCAEDILLNWCPIRVKIYEERRKHQLEVLKKKLHIIENRVKFITHVAIKKDIEIRKRKREDIEGDLIKFEIDKIDGKFDYLLDMPIWSLTHEKIESLNKEYEKIKSEYNTLKKKTPLILWSEELDALEEEYKRFKDEQLEAIASEKGLSEGVKEALAFKKKMKKQK